MNVPQLNSPQLPQRAYGTTGIKLSIIGLGGIVVTNTEPEQAGRIVAKAIERGVNYFDVAPSYGNAEDRLGPALEPYRSDVFLACKTAERERKGAEEQFKQSLGKLRTDYFDLYQIHGLIDVEKEVDLIFSKGGAMEFVMEAKKTGQIRHVGFSAHSEEAAFAAMDRYDFDSILFPINFATYYKGHFGSKVIAKAESKHVARLALKSLARQPWTEQDPQQKKYPKCWYQPLTDLHQIELALKFTLSQPITAALPPGEESLFWPTLDFATRFQPITEQEIQELKILAEDREPIFSSTEA